MDDTGAKVIDLIFGRWRSQILYTGVKLGVFDALASGPKNAVRVASELGVDAGMLYRLMRAQGCTYEAIQQQTGMATLTVLKWVRRFAREGIEGLATRPSRKRPRW